MEGARRGLLAIARLGLRWGPRPPSGALPTAGGAAHGAAGPGGRAAWGGMGGRAFATNPLGCEAIDDHAGAATGRDSHPRRPRPRDRMLHAAGGDSHSQGQGRPRGPGRNGVTPGPSRVERLLGGIAGLPPGDAEGGVGPVMDELLANEGDEWDQILPYAVLFNICYAVGIPAMFAILLWMIRGHLEDPLVVRILGPITGRFKEEWYWFECIVLLRKQILVAISIMFSGSSPNTELQRAIIGMAVSFAAMLLQVFSNPYADEALSKLDVYSIGGHFFYIFAGIVYLADSLNDEKNLANPLAEPRVVMSDGFRFVFTLIVTGLMFIQFSTMMVWVAVDVFPGLSSHRFFGGLVHRAKKTVLKKKKTTRRVARRSSAAVLNVSLRAIDSVESISASITPQVSASAEKLRGLTRRMSNGSDVAGRLRGLSRRRSDGTMSDELSRDSSIASLVAGTPPATSDADPQGPPPSVVGAPTPPPGPAPSTPSRLSLATAASPGDGDTGGPESPPNPPPPTPPPCPPLPKEGTGTGALESSSDRAPGPVTEGFKMHLLLESCAGEATEPPDLRGWLEKESASPENSGAHAALEAEYRRCSDEYYGLDKEDWRKSVMRYMACEFDVELPSDDDDAEDERPAAPGQINERPAAPGPVTESFGMYAGYDSSVYGPTPLEPAPPLQPSPAAVTEAFEVRLFPIAGQGSSLHRALVSNEIGAGAPMQHSPSLPKLRGLVINPHVSSATSPISSPLPSTPGVSSPGPSGVSSAGSPGSSVGTPSRRLNSASSRLLRSSTVDKILNPREHLPLRDREGVALNHCCFCEVDESGNRFAIFSERVGMDGVEGGGNDGDLYLPGNGSIQMRRHKLQKGEDPVKEHYHDNVSFRPVFVRILTAVRFAETLMLGKGAANTLTRRGRRLARTLDRKLFFRHPCGSSGQLANSAP